MYNNASPGQVSGSTVFPFVRPAMKSNSAAKPGVLKCCGPFLPIRRDCRGLVLSDGFLGKSPLGVVFVGVIYPNPVPPIILPVRSIECSAVILYREIHTV